LIKLCVLLTMSVASATAEMLFSVLRCLKNYVRSTMDWCIFIKICEVDLYKAIEVFVSAKTRRADFGQF
jgi:hypothetical protein